MKHANPQDVPPVAHLVPVEQAAPRMCRHPITLRRDLREGRVPGIKVGGRWYMSSEDLNRMTEGKA